MKATNYSRLYQIAMEAQATCAQLLANAQVVEKELNVLRSEHEALRLETCALKRCLERTGALPKELMETERRNEEMVQLARGRSTPRCTKRLHRGSCEFQSIFQAALDGKGLASLHALLRVQPEAFQEYSDPGTPGTSALSAAVRKNKMDLTKILLKARADPNQRDAKGVSALHLCAFDGNLELCKVLALARADVDACDRHGQSPLFFAPNKDVCKMLVERKSDVNVLNRRGQSALHMAGRAGLHEVLSWLSSRVSRALCDLKDVHGITAKTYAKMSGIPMQIPSPIPVHARSVSRSKTPEPLKPEPLPSVSTLVPDALTAAAALATAAVSTAAELTPAEPTELEECW